MIKERVLFGEFDIPIPKGHERITDKDDTTDYLFVSAPGEIYTLYFDSGMPLYGENVLGGCREYGSMEIKFHDRKISFFCPVGFGGRKSALWYFNIEFTDGNGDVRILPGQIMMKYDEVYRKAVGGKLPFIEILEKIQLNLSTTGADSAVPV